MGAAAMDDLNRRAQAEYPGSLGGRHLTNAMTHNDRRAQSARAQRRRGRALDGKYEWLGDTRERELQGVVEQGFDKRPTRQFFEMSVDLIEPRAKPDIVSISRSAHADPLTAVSRIDEGHRNMSPIAVPVANRLLSSPVKKELSALATS